MKHRAALLALLATPLAATARDYPAPVQTVVDQGVEISAEFEAPGGLTGYAGRVQGQPIVIYVLEDGETAIIGSMLDSEGRNLTAQQLEQHLPPPDLEPDWKQLEQADVIVEGPKDAERAVYVFTDPNCPYCQRFWEAAQPYLEKQNVQLRHVMVAILGPSSMGKTAQILAADDPAAMLAKHETTFEEGGIEGLEQGEVSQEVAQRIMANNQLMQRLGVRATPAIYYRDAEGNVQQVMGLPDPQTLEEIFH